MRGEQDAPGEGIDRRATHELVAVEVAISRRKCAEIGDDHEQGRCAIKRLGKSLGRRLGFGRRSIRSDRLALFSGCEG